MSIHELEGKDFYSIDKNSERAFLKMYSWAQAQRRLKFNFPSSYLDPVIITHELIDYRLYWHKNSTNEQILACTYIGISFRQHKESASLNYVIIKPWNVQT